MVSDYLISVLQVIAFASIALGWVLCLWAVVIDAQDADIDDTSSMARIIHPASMRATAAALTRSPNGPPKRTLTATWASRTR